MAHQSPSPPSLESVLSAAFLTSAQAVLSARVYQPNKQPEQAPGKRKSWFNLELDEVESANKALEPWRRDVGRPLVLEVFLQPWGAAEPQALQPGQAPVETLLEQWVFHYQPSIMSPAPGLSRSQLSRLNPTSIYKRLIIMLRSLFCYVRVLPAYRMFRVCKRQRGSNFTIGYRVSGTLPKRPPSAGSPSSSAAAAASVPSGSGSGSGSSKGRGSSSSRSRGLQHFEFAPVDTPYGQFKASVAYQPASKVQILEQTTSPPPLPQIIADYVGGPRSAGRAPGQLPLRHAMSAQPVSDPQAAGAARSPGAGVPASPTAADALQRQSSGFAPLPRHSWSSSAMRISPNRLPSPYSQPPPVYSGGGDAASPFAQAPTPYGSAPQLGPLHSPQLQRALSLQRGLSGTPPRSRPPLPPQRGSEGSSPAATGYLAGRPIPPPRARSSALPSQLEEGEEEGEGEELSAAGTSARHISAPMSIPGRSPGHARRLHSSGDLWGMHQPTEHQKPLSAPAVSHLQQPGAQPGSHETGGAGSHTTDASLPPGPLPLIPGSQLESESSGSATSSALFPTSCSPQLPFAFTPSAQSLASYGSRGLPLQESASGQLLTLERTSPRLRRASFSAGAGGGALQAAAASPGGASSGAGGPGSSAGSAGCGLPPSWPPGAGRGHGGALLAASPGSAGTPRQQGGQHVQFSEEVVVTGREVPTASALARRASWSGRSSAHLRKSSLESGGVGYSVSPMQDPLLESMLAGSTPRQYSFAAPPTPPYAALGGAPAGRISGLSRTSSSVSGGTPPPLLTYPSSAPSEPSEPGMRSGGFEADVLPFALDSDASRAALPMPPSAAPSRDAFGSPTSLPGASGGEALAPSPAPDAAAATSAAAPAGPARAASLEPTDGPSSDAAVGAFVRLLKEAPPLRSFGGSRAAAPADPAPTAAAAGCGSAGGSGGGGAAGARLTLQAGLRQFELIRERLESRGVVRNVVDL